MSKENDESKKQETVEDKTESKPGTKSWLPRVGLVLLAALVLSVGYYGYLFASTPSHLRNPEFEHYHLRAQIIVDGEAVDFSRAEFQEEYDATSCSAELTGSPVDFHDDMDQMAHIHWSGITGGEFLKYYGWNLIGGDDDSLGRRYDQGMMSMHHIDTAGDLLPELPNNANFYVYVGDEDGYEQKNWDDFLNQDFEEFFDKKSRLNTDDESSFNIFDYFSPKAYAHGMEDDGHDEVIEGEDEEVRLERINNLVGNVVIFVQDSEPTQEQIEERFNSLAPLHDSVCGG